MAAEDLNAIYQKLGTLSLEELRALNHIIVTIVNQQIKIKAMQAACTFMVGDKVTWMSKRGCPVDGVVTKVKSKNIDVDAGVNGRWVVTATMLKKVV